MGAIYLIRGVPLSIVLYIGLLGVLYFCKIRKLIQPKIMIVEFTLIAYILSILNITGIIGMQFNINWFIHSSSSLGFYLPSGRGEMMMVILNVALFIPLGVLIPIVFRHMNWSWMKILFVGVIFSTIIEFLQMFGGRASELNDIITNATGTIIGYFLYRMITYIILKRDKDQSTFKL